MRDTAASLRALSNTSPARNSPCLYREQEHVLAASLCLANLVTTVLVKLLSTVAVGHAIAANTEAVPFQFCSCWVVVSRLCWAVLPASLLVTSWARLVAVQRPGAASRLGSEATLDPWAGEGEGVLTRRHNILREREVVRVMRASLPSADSKLRPPASGQEEQDTINLARAWRSRAADRREESASRKRRVLKQKSKSTDGGVDEVSPAPARLCRQHSFSCSELSSTAAAGHQLGPIKEEDGARLQEAAVTRLLPHQLSLKSSTQSLTGAASSPRRQQQQVSFDESLSSLERPPPAQPRARLSTATLPSTASTTGSQVSPSSYLQYYILSTQ